MKIEYDKNKSNTNSAKHGYSFEAVHEFDWETAIIKEDTRKPYPERRFVASGFLNTRLHILCFARIKDGVRVISFRKANKREVKEYEEAKAINK